MSMLRCERAEWKEMGLSEAVDGRGRPVVSTDGRE
jgi:hypothetical protein